MLWRRGRKQKTVHSNRSDSCNLRISRGQMNRNRYFSAIHHQLYTVVRTISTDNNLLYTRLHTPTREHDEQHNRPQTIYFLHTAKKMLVFRVIHEVVQYRVDTIQHKQITQTTRCRHCSLLPRTTYNTQYIHIHKLHTQTTYTHYPFILDRRLFRWLATAILLVTLALLLVAVGPAELRRCSRRLFWSISAASAWCDVVGIRVES